MRADVRHWALFRDLCSRADCRGNLVQDAYLAALALEHDCVFVTTDRDFARFPGLRCDTAGRPNAIQNPA